MSDVGIGGLEDYILKSAALSSTVACPAFTDMYQEATPIVRVAIEPHNMSGFCQFSLMEFFTQPPMRRMCICLTDVFFCFFSVFFHPPQKYQTIVLGND